MGRIVVFVMKGCGACEDFLPRIRKLAKARGIKLEVQDLVTDKKAAQLGTSLGIEATPTTLLYTARGNFKQVGAVDDPMIGRMLDAVAR